MSDHLNSKWWLDSKTVRGGLLQIAPITHLILKVFGVEVTDAETGTVIDAIVGLVSAAGVVLTIVGRAEADRPIRLKK